MNEISIPCEKIARLANVLRYFPDVADDWTDSFRFEDDMILVTNRHFLAIERHDGGSISKPVHMTASAELINQCKTEMAYSSKIQIIVNDTLGLISARTTLGYQYPGNLLHRGTGENAMDRWRNIVPSGPAKESNNGWMLEMDHFQMFAESSPSKCIVFEKSVDIHQPSIVRDLVDPDWFGVFWAKDVKHPHSPATLPKWFK